MMSVLFDKNILSKEASLLLEPALLDRTGTFHALDNITVIQPLPKPEPHDFYSLCMNRAEEIIALNKKIYLLWSGGADSTLVFLLLERQGIRDDQLVILVSSDSVVINPAMDHYLTDHYEIDCPSLYPDKLRAFMGDDSLILSGIGLDMLTSGFDVDHADSNELHDLIRYFQSRTAGTEQEYHTIFARLSEAAGRPCDTVQQFSRLKNMVLCWQPELLTIGRLANYGVYGQHFLNFYQTTKFQQWSFFNAKTGKDALGNKQIVVDIMDELDSRWLPKVKPRFTLPQLFENKETLRMTNDGQYICNDS